MAERNMGGVDAAGADVQEQQHAADGIGGASTEEGGPDVGLETPDADAAEQAAVVRPREHVLNRDLPLDADEADAAEQSIVVEHDDDDYR